MPTGLALSLRPGIGAEPRAEAWEQRSMGRASGGRAEESGVKPDPPGDPTGAVAWRDAIGGCGGGARVHVSAMEFAVRAYEPADLPALYRICLLTGDAGADATALYADPELLGHYYAAPYAVLEPELCYVLTGDGKVCGYVLGTRDAVEFAGRAEREWFPALRERLPRPREEDLTADAALLRLIHRGFAVAPGFRDHPAELHIDLLPAAQGLGWGRRLIERFCVEVRARGAAGVRLGVSERNAGAMAFYERIGFALLGRYPGWRAYGRRWAEAHGLGGT